MSARVSYDRTTGLYAARWLMDGEPCSYESPNRVRVLSFVAALSGVSFEQAEAEVSHDA